MRDSLAGELLSTVLDWDTATFAAQGRVLQTLARYKYDEYEGFRPGERFIESLAAWLFQFKVAERPTALRFVSQELVFISRAELDHLIETIYPDMIRPALLRDAAPMIGQPDHKVSTIAGSPEFRDLQRRTLILGLADGARLDRLRRASPELSHEQFYPHPELGVSSRESMRTNLSKALELMHLSGPATFRNVLLVEDFAGSGYTLLGQDPEGAWRGKLWKAAGWIQDLKDADLVDAGASVSVLLYLASEMAQHTLDERLTSSGLGWHLDVAQVLRSDMNKVHSEMLGLCEKYFDPASEDEHLAKGGTPPHLGFGGIALPLVLHHNTPNNSIGLLWADTTHLPTSDMRRALFPRRQRHNPDRP